jgi:hypothetical protein
MMKSKKRKPSKEAASVLHRFMHKTRSGNVVSTELIVPRVGQVSHFDALWERSPSEADLNEQEPWLASMAKTANDIGGRRLTLRFVDERGRTVEFPAMEAVT